MSVLGTSIHALHGLQARRVTGTVAAVRGLSLLVDDLPLSVGAVVRLERGGAGSAAAGRNDDALRGEVIGFDEARSIVMLFRSSAGVAPGARVIGEQATGTVGVGDRLLGRVIDALGRPMDGLGPLSDLHPRPLLPPPTGALERRRIDEPLPTGIRAVDALLTIGKGQRLGIFSGPGVGKSTLLASIARNTGADVNVITLVGERGREVRDFIELALGPEGRARSVVVVATGDESPLLRVRAALVASAIAEHFRDTGADVMLMMDSITRFAQAQRQIGLTVGEQPATRGYTPTVFSQLSSLLERAGAMTDRGSITGLYTVLVEGDDLNEPVSDAARGILDGHVGLSRRMAARGHHPAIDVLESVSRVADDVCDEHHVAARRTIIRLLAAWAETEELINIGAYASGSNLDCDVAIEMKEELDAFLRQDPGSIADYAMTCRELLELAARAQAKMGKGRKV